MNQVRRKYTQIKPDRPLPKRAPVPIRADYHRYESLKAELSPELTPSEYSNAVRDIARECGV